MKVQYPGIGEAIRADLDNADMMFQAMGVMFPGLDPGPLVEELKLRLGEELDYRLEAEHQMLFADYYQGHPYITRARRACRVLDRAGADHRARPRAPAGTSCWSGARRSATWRPRPSTGSCSAASTAWVSSTATRTPATTCSSPAVT